MHSKLLSRLAMTSRAIVVVAFSVAVYLALGAPSTFIVSDRQAELSSIEAATTVAELKARASGLAMIGNNATQASRVLFSIAVATLLLFTVLSLLNLIWLRRLRRSIDETNAA